MLKVIVSILKELKYAFAFNCVREFFDNDEHRIISDRYYPYNSGIIKKEKDGFYYYEEKQ